MHSNIFINFFYKLAGKYPTPSNLSYLWNFGVFALIALVIQLITVIILVMHYTPHIDYSFLPFYAILRSIPDKSLGVIALLVSILCLFVFPFLHRSFLRSSFMKPVYRIILLSFFTIAVLLGYIGSKLIEYPFLVIGQLLTLGYFGFLFIVMILDRRDFVIIKYLMKQKISKKSKVLYSSPIIFLVFPGVLLIFSTIFYTFPLHSILRMYSFLSLGVTVFFLFLPYSMNQKTQSKLLSKMVNNNYFLHIVGFVVLVARYFNTAPIPIAKNITNASSVTSMVFIFLRIAIALKAIMLEGSPFFSAFIVFFYIFAFLNTILRLCISIGTRTDMLGSPIVYSAVDGLWEALKKSAKHMGNGLYRSMYNQLPPPPPPTPLGPEGPGQQHENYQEQANKISKTAVGISLFGLGWGILKILLDDSSEEVREHNKNIETIKKEKNDIALRRSYEKTLAEEKRNDMEAVKNGFYDGDAYAKKWNAIDRLSDPVERYSKYLHSPSNYHAPRPPAYIKKSDASPSNLTAPGNTPDNSPTFDKSDLTDSL